MKIVPIVIILYVLLSVGCNSEKSDYDAGIAAYNRGHYSVALSDFESRAMKGDSVAQFCLGFMYKHGKGVAEDPEKAEGWYKKAANQDYAAAQNNLAIIYFRRAEEALNKTEAALNEFIEGKGASEMLKEFRDNSDIALQWFQKAAAHQNNHVAQYNLALTWYSRAVTVEHAAEGAARMKDKILRFLSEDSTDPQGEKILQELLVELESVILNSPSNAVKAYENAINWFTKATEKGYRRAQYELGNRYYHNEGVDKNLTKIQKWKKAVELYEKAEKQNYAPAQNALAKMYAEGKGVDKNFTKAIELYKKAAEQNDVDAQFNLAEMYTGGEEIDENLTETERWKEVVEWYTKAADQGNAAAQNNLAIMYAKGEGGPENPEKAARLYFTAAQQGYPVAQANVGLNFEQGKYGVPQDNAEAYYWYSLALRDPAKLDKLTTRENFAATVTKWRKDVGNNLDDEDKSEIQKRVDDWKPKTLFASGTGFYIDKNHVLTNAHVVRQEEKFRDESKWYKYDELRVGFRYVIEKSVDHDTDLALLYDERGNSDTAIFRSSPIKVVEEVFVFGYPKSNHLSYDGNFTSGTVSGLSHMIDVPQPDNRFQHTAPTQRGNSGGPVFDSVGNVVGVSVSGLPDRYFDEETRQYLNLAQNINFAIKFDVIKGFLEKNKIKIAFKSTHPIEDVEDPIGRRQKIFNQAQKFTVPVLCFKNRVPEPFLVVQMGVAKW